MHATGDGVPRVAGLGVNGPSLCSALVRRLDQWAGGRSRLPHAFPRRSALTREGRLTTIPPSAPAPVAPLSAALRSAIQDLHAAIERTPIAAAIIGVTVTRTGYAALLARLDPLHGALERAVHAAPAVASLFPEALLWKAAALREDLAALGRVPTPIAPPVMPGSPAELTGAAYVVAGSSLGSAVVRPLLARAFGVVDGPGVGLDYHAVPPAALADWPATRARLDALALAPAEREAALGGARRMMGAMLSAYEQSPP